MKHIILTALMSAGLILLNPAFSFAETIIKKGNIKGVSVSWTTGSVKIVKTAKGHELRLGNNFKTKKGPALFVFLGNDKPKKRLGRLKSIEGSQTYKIPASINPDDFKKVFIHCVPFNATFGSGILK